MKPDNDSSGTGVERIAIDKLRLDGGTQLRARIEGAIVGEYSEALAAGMELPPVTVFHDGKDLWLADGFHRVEAHRKRNAETIVAEVHQGSLRDAILYSVGANIAHGLRRSNEDKGRSVHCLLSDAEWGGWSDREIARRAGVSHTFVQQQRKALATVASGVSEEAANGVRTTRRRGGDGRITETANIGRGKRLGESRKPEASGGRRSSGSGVTTRGTIKNVMTLHKTFMDMTAMLEAVMDLTPRKDRAVDVMSKAYDLRKRLDVFIAKRESEY